MDAQRIFDLCKKIERDYGEFTIACYHRLLKFIYKDLTQEERKTLKPFLEGENGVISYLESFSDKENVRIKFSDFISDYLNFIDNKYYEEDEFCEASIIFNIYAALIASHIFKDNHLTYVEICKDFSEFVNVKAINKINNSNSIWNIYFSNIIHVIECTTHNRYCIRINF